MNLTLSDRTKIFDKVCRLVEIKHFNPGMNGGDWNDLARSRRDQILGCAEPGAFEKEVQRLVAELKTSHTGFRHAGMRNIPARHAINATMQRIAVPRYDPHPARDPAKMADQQLSCRGNEESGQYHDHMFSSL
jgi:hypothetical protein